MDVVRTNFEEILPQIEEALLKCEFVAIDAEFTGLTLNESQRPSLFDAPCDRYRKLKQVVGHFLVSQFGISAFVQSKDFPNTYEVHSYNIYLFPTSFGQIDARFTCQASSLEFLCNHKFDFNKFIKEGVSFLNKTQKEELRELCVNNHLKIAGTLNRILERDFITPQCEEIEKWLKENKENILVLECKEAFLQFLLYQEVRKKFPNLTCDIGTQGKLQVKKNSEKVDVENYKEQINRIVEHCCGFSRVFDLLVKFKKPLLGHNIFTDVLFMYEKFHKALPDEYHQFKRDIHELFPCIIDTKHLAYSLGRQDILRESGLFKKTSLEELYTELSSHKGLYYVLYTPTIIHSKNCQKYANTCNAHEAGYDAYICGYIFIRMAHILTAKLLGANMDGPLEFHQYFDSVENWCNKINLPRARTLYLNLVGDDPEITRPHWIHISQRGRFKKITAAQIMKELERFGSLDVKVLDNRRALVATSHFQVSRRVFTAFRRHKKLKVRKYYPLFDNPRFRAFLWASGVTTAILTLFIGGVAALYYGKRTMNNGRQL
ncbi:poly(A)-specific ribonuclease PNLDC1-like isoform X2 [Xenia sp. Carnegie-2017]|uniref:poly(A)-specific ribonuclease PNLDC1-like isoform X2 n=1 Tax=Xenia sp. Carnegie-2017 TaxID=2897299 RepID=UPI001F043755|nr:poly(A)-specific ribonuclease PNLDC1-like isoform X2 [Xenia sp. Carnegie-2017]